MGLTVYKGNDFGASGVLPALGQAGQMIAILDACLVNGYGDQPVSITRSGSVATIVLTEPHTDSRTNRYAISGCTEGEYNGTHRVTVVDAYTYTFEVTGTPASPATGSPVGRKPPAGWTKAFSGTNKAAYKMGAGSNGLYMRLDDSGAGPTKPWRGYEQMSSVDIGSGPFPTVAQHAAPTMRVGENNALYDEDWTIFADETYFLLVMQHGDISTDLPIATAMADFDSVVPGDAFNTLISVHTSGANNFGLNISSAGIGASSATNTVARGIDGLSGATLFGYMSPDHGGRSGGTMTYPNAADNAIYMERRRITHVTPNPLIRGIDKYAYGTPHIEAFLPHLTAFGGSGDFAGKEFIVVQFHYGSLVIEVSD